MTEREQALESHIRDLITQVGDAYELIEMIDCRAFGMPRDMRAQVRKWALAADAAVEHAREFLEETV